MLIVEETKRKQLLVIKLNDTVFCDIIKDDKCEWGRGFMQEFSAYVVREENGQVTGEIENLKVEDLTEGSVLIRVEYSSLNYKDMLAFQKHGGVIRNYPLIPGIDLAGTVMSSTTAAFKEGDQVLGTGYGLGVTYNGGLAEYAKLPEEWLIKLPADFSTRSAMIYGTAGLTAGLSIAALLKAGMKPSDQVLVTGASGGVGSIAVKILASLGYKNLTALVRKPGQVDVVKGLGATTTLEVTELQLGRPLQHQTFDYVLDTVGGDVAAALLTMLKTAGAMSMCGNVGGHKLSTSVLPFILRGVSLLGIDSVTPAIEKKDEIWQKLATDWNVTDKLVVDEVPLAGVKKVLQKLKAGQHLGRTIVKISKD